MAELKTKENDESVTVFLDSLEDKAQRKDCKALLALMKSITGKPPKMWGTSIIGFGSYHYKYKSGHEGDSMIAGFAPRKQNISIYIMPGFLNYQALMKKLGKHKTGKSCLYIKTLSDVDQDILRELVEKSVNDMREMYECV